MLAINQIRYWIYRNEFTGKTTKNYFVIIGASKVDPYSLELRWMKSQMLEDMSINWIETFTFPAEDID